MTASTQTRLTVAGLLATLLSAVTLHPLVRDLAWTLPVLIVVGIVVGTGAAVRQVTRSWPLVLAVQVLALAIALTTLFVRESGLWGVLPDPAALAALRELVADGFSITRQAAAPVPDTTGVILLMAGGMGAVALVVDLVAVGLGRPAVAGLPLLAVYCVPAAVLPDGVGWQYFVVAAIGYLLLVSADAGDRVRGWGRVLGGRSGELGPVGLGGPLSGARRVAAVSLVAAVVIPLMVPGLGERILTNGSGAGPGKGSGKISVLNPILTLRQNLGARSKETVISYRTTVAAPDPLRIVTDDAFDGERWAPSTGPVPREQRVQNGLSPAPGLATAVATTPQQTEISIGNLKETYLPLPYPSTRVEIEGGWLYETRSLNVVGDGIFTTGIDYTAFHLAVTPTPDQLRAASAAPIQVTSTYTKLPADLPQAIRTTAVDVAGRGNAYDQAVKLQGYLRTSGGFSYSEDVPGNGADDSGEDAVLAFLKAKRGYCVQFASAMAVMARTLGIPARVAVGFLPGKQTAPGRFEITLQDAHAWPELYFEGVGWVRFEPTPATRVQNAPSYSIAPQEAQATPSASASSAAAPDAAAPSARPAPEEAGTAAADQPSAGSRVWHAVPWRILAGVAAALLLLLVPAAVSWWVRRRRWARAGAPGHAAEAAWDDLRERLSDLGVRWAASWTPRALLRRLSTEHAVVGSERTALERLVGEIETARYAPPGGLVTGRGAGEVRQDVDVVVDAVAAGCSKGSRRRARWFPRSGVEVLTGLGRRMDVAAENAGRRVGEVGSQVRSEVRRTVDSGRRSE